MSDPLSPRAARWLATGLCLAWLAFALPRLVDYGATWDCVLGEYPAGEQYLQYLKTGDAAWLDFSRDPYNTVPDSVEDFGIAAAPRVQPAASDEAPPTGPRMQNREPHLHYEPWLYDWYESHPLGALLSAASCRLLWGRLALVPSLAAHNVPIVLLVGLLLWVLVAAAARRWGLIAGTGTALALLLAPRFLCDAFNNLKDTPEAVLYTLALLTWAAALRRGRWLLFVAAGALTGLALAQKANALFLPPQVLIFVLLANVLRRRRGEARLVLPWRALLLAALTGIACWLLCSPMLWVDPLGRFRVQLNYFAGQGRQSFVAQDFDALRAFLCTTPPVLLLLAAAGAANGRACGEQRLLFGLGVLFPVARTLLPGAINFDGVRHFLEFMPCLAVLAGLGLDLVLREAARRFAAAWRPAARAAAGALLAAALLAPAAWACVDTWPFGNCYWNGFAGGLSGAQRNGWRSSTDYWAASYWQGFDWLSQHAEPDAGVFVTVAWHVADAIAPLRLRPDLKLLSSPNAPKRGYPKVLYFAYVTNKAFYGPATWELEQDSVPVLQIEVQGAPILRIHRVDDEDEVRRLLDLARTRNDPRAAALRMGDWLAALPDAERTEIEDDLLALLTGDHSHVGRLIELIPERLHRDTALMLQAPPKLWRR